MVSRSRLSIVGSSVVTLLVALSPGLSAAEQSVPELVKKASESYKASRFAEAEELLEKALQLQPTLAEGLVLRAHVRYRLRTYDGAVRDFKSAERLGYDLGSSQTVRGECQLRVGQTGAAIKTLSATIRRKRSYVALHWRAVAYQILGKFKQAAADAKAAADLEPKEGPRNSNLLEIRILIQKSSLAQARELLSTRLTRNPKDVSALLLSSICFVQSNSNRGAAKELSRALNALPAGGGKQELGLWRASFTGDKKALTQFAQLRTWHGVVAAVLLGRVDFAEGKRRLKSTYRQRFLDSCCGMLAEQEGRTSAAKSAYKRCIGNGFETQTSLPYLWAAVRLERLEETKSSREKPSR